MKPKRINYLSQEQIRAAIHESKKSFCWYADDHYADFDVIVRASTEITPEAAQAAMAKKADQATKRAREAGRQAKGSGLTPGQSNALVVDPQTYQTSDVVFRLMTDEHVPDDPNASGRQRKTGKAATNFAPFKHYIVDDAGILTEVGRSHWEGGLGNGSFSVTHGRITDKLGRIYMLLSERLSTKGNYRGYTYIDEMRGQALETLCKYGLKFDESKSDNAFAYLTVCCTNAFVRVLNEEKKMRDMRDDMLQDMGQMPSMTRQIENERKASGEPEPTPLSKRKGRPKGNGPAAIKPRDPRIITAHGESRTVYEWAAHVGISANIIYMRLQAGKEGEDAVAPARGPGRPRKQPAPTDK